MLNNYRYLKWKGYLEAHISIYIPSRTCRCAVGIRCSKNQSERRNKVFFKSWGKLLVGNLCQGRCVNSSSLVPQMWEVWIVIFCLTAASTLRALGLQILPLPLTFVRVSLLVQECTTNDTKSGGFIGPLLFHSLFCILLILFID